MTVEFGNKRPVDFNDAVNRLPQENDPRIPRDMSINRLSGIRDLFTYVLSSYEVSKEESDIEARISRPLGEDDINLMEDWSFKRIKSSPPFTYNFSWSKINNPRIWGEEEANVHWENILKVSEYDFYAWEISGLTPMVPTNFPYIATSIKIGGNFEPYYQWQSESVFHIGLLKPTELKSLVETLYKNAY